MFYVSAMTKPIPAPHEPLFYDDLDAVRREAFRLLSRGVADRRSPFHTPVVATIGMDGLPQARTVVLRGFEPEARVLRFHTDRRAGKIAELRQVPAASLLFYDAGAKIQVRVAGSAQVHHGDAVAEAAWAKTRPFSRLCYRQAAAPGDTIDGPAYGLGDNADDGFDQFTIVRVTITTLDWLYLSVQGHRRARFVWPSDNTPPEASWVAP